MVTNVLLLNYVSVPNVKVILKLLVPFLVKLSSS